MDVQWWTGDRLHKHYANRGGTGKDFRVRSMPAIGYTKNTNGPATHPPALFVTEGVGPDGQTASFDGASETIDLYPVPLTTADEEAERKRVLAARTTFPDPWDLPAAAPLLPKSADKPNAGRDDFMSVGVQRGVWVDPNDVSRRGRENRATFLDSAGGGGGSNYKPNDGRQTVADPGNKFATPEDPQQGDIVSLASGAAWPEVPV